MQDEAYAIVRRAIEQGVTLFDTAELYGAGRSERVLGRALGDDRASAFLATKIFPLLPVAPIVRQRATASAKRLRVSRLDLYQVHQPNPLVGDGPLMRGMRSLQDTGMVAEVGVSNYSVERWRTAERALGRPIMTNQVAYSLVHRAPEQDLLPFAAANGHLIIAYSPLAKGLLAGNYHHGVRPTNAVRARDPDFHSRNLERTTNLLNVLREVATAHSATPAQIALAWVIHRPAVVAIPGASSLDQLESNVNAAEIELAEDEYQALCQASTSIQPVAVEPSFVRRDLSAFKQMARAGTMLAQTAWRDHQVKHTRRGRSLGLGQL